MESLFIDPPKQAGMGVREILAGVKKTSGYYNRPDFSPAYVTRQYMSMLPPTV